MKDIKKEFLTYFEGLDHKIIPSAPIIPENDPTCLFITAGMQPLIPYLKGEPHPEGVRLADVQKCFRTNDLDSVGDAYHHTFFEMLGNWSLGDYFKKESIAWSYDFLTKRLNISHDKLAVTVFKGNNIVEADLESANYWMSHGISEEKIAYLGEDDNWWPNIDALGPCGPDTEIFYFRSDDETPEKFDPKDERWVEIWNNVFMQYNHVDEKTFIPLKNKNVDTGMGVERVTAILENVSDNYQTSIFKDVINYLEKISAKKYESDEVKVSMRIIADHIRASVMIIGDEANILPSNTDQGYVLRRLIRRAIRHVKKLDIEINSNWEEEIANIYILKYENTYPELNKNKENIKKVLKEEKEKFAKTLANGLKEFNKIISNLKDNKIDAINAFKLYDTFGFPIELTNELAKELKIEVDIQGFNQKFIEHQEKSRLGSAQKFKGGLASDGIMETKYHTATHLLNAALKEVLGPHVHQKGSNITSERMRFDFSHNAKMSEEEIRKTEDLVNNYIKDELKVMKREMTKEKALEENAEAMFLSKYGDIVTVYEIGNVSKELCGGPHVLCTKELGHFKIVKEEASSAGVRRIKAILE